MKDRMYYERTYYVRKEMLTAYYTKMGFAPHDAVSLAISIITTERNIDELVGYYLYEFADPVSASVNEVETIKSLIKGE